MVDGFIFHICDYGTFPANIGGGLGAPFNMHIRHRLVDVERWIIETNVSSASIVSGPRRSYHRIYWIVYFCRRTGEFTLRTNLAVGILVLNKVSSLCTTLISIWFVRSRRMKLLSPSFTKYSDATASPERGALLVHILAVMLQFQPMWDITLSFGSCVTVGLYWLQDKLRLFQKLENRWYRYLGAHRIMNSFLHNNLHVQLGVVFWNAVEYLTERFMILFHTAIRVVRRNSAYFLVFASPFCRRTPWFWSKTFFVAPFNISSISRVYTQLNFN